MKKLLVVILLVTLASHLNAQTQSPKITATIKPWTRWWWMGSAVDEKNYLMHPNGKSNHRE